MSKQAQIDQLRASLTILETQRALRGKSFLFNVPAPRTVIKRWKQIAAPSGD